MDLPMDDDSLIIRYPHYMEGFTGAGLACIRSERIVFAGLGFAVSPGGALILSGPNGSGKSSLLRLMAGIAKPAAGTISWRGTELAGDPERFYTDMHYVGHRDAVKPALTVRENLAFHVALRASTGTGAADIDAALDRVGLAALADLPARMLSAGQTRRLTLARILASPAALWLLDEPTIALDTQSVERIHGAIAAHRAGGGILVASTNVPLRIEDALTIDMAAYAADGETIWGYST
jgi:heme exporter protein A